jgi:glycosyltransferase involved in cell wall biosynthesis
MGYGQAYAALLKARAEELGVADRLLLHPPVLPEQIPSYASSADATLCIIENISRSYYHAIPQKFYESLQAGVPVVASNFPEMTRLVQKFQIGASVDPDDTEDILRGILGITAGGGSKERWRKRCDIASQALTWENEFPILLDAVGRVLPLPASGQELKA